MCSVEVDDQGRYGVALANGPGRCSGFGLLRFARTRRSLVAIAHGILDSARMRTSCCSLCLLCLGCGAASSSTPAIGGDDGGMPNGSNTDASDAGFVRAEVGCGELRKPDDVDGILARHKQYLMSPGSGERANLSCSDLRGADLTQAMLDGADLHGAVCDGETELRAVSLKQADLRGVDFAHAFMIGAMLDEADASGADFSNTVLTSATFIGATLSSASLQNVNASYVKYIRATFDGAYLDPSSLAGADVSGADLRNARNLRFAELRDACGDAETKLPSGLTVQPCAP